MIQGNIITIDAMGTQTEIAKKINKNRADYILAVKENQKQLLEEVIDEFKFSKDIKIDTYIDMEHGRLHWTLYVGFFEDASRKRAVNTDQNYSVLIKIALNLLKNEKYKKQGVTGKRLKAAWNEKYLLYLT